MSPSALGVNTSGVTGDKPIETIGEVGKTALTGGTSTVLKQAASAAGLTGTTTNVEKAATAATGSACADGSCAVPATKWGCFKRATTKKERFPDFGKAFSFSQSSASSRLGELHDFRLVLLR